MENKQVIEVLEQVIRERELTNKINDLEKDVIRNSTEIKHLNKSINHIEDLVSSLYNMIGKLNTNLDNRFDKIEQKIDDTSEKFDTINDELLVRRLINKTLDKHPYIMRFILVNFVLMMIAIILYLFAYFLN